MPATLRNVAGYYSRSDDQPTHMFKTQCLNKETHFREDHHKMVLQQPPSKRHPRNVLIAEETPRTRPPTEEQRKQLTGSVEPGRQFSEYGKLSVTPSRLGERCSSPPRSYFDVSYTRTVSSLRSAADAKLAELQRLVALHDEVDNQVAAKPKEQTQALLKSDAWVRDQAGTSQGNVRETF
eukprot:CAMPEP_0171601064 /NCGR_PEP_ID=MMETSP0990-20121206/4695_1 /TAXON_ID=483369 /ORGANISM="non described non described, Strain CCMP2098" /LENGTH=179 /DNA_ID=CAMNT_0012163139 /DNA_START=97 /DNA_END=636 /DNA_ORIENTATION=-